MGGLTFGAIGAALIAAVVSLIGLILGKEQKTSEFRQEWINKLREEIATYVTNVSVIADHLKLEFKDDTEKLKTLAPYYSQINSAANSIKLRLNPEEERSSIVLNLMAEVESASHVDADFSSARVLNLEEKLISESQILLKEEWVRVKKGERAFKWAKYSALTSAVMLFGFLVFVAFKNLEASEEGKKLQTSHTEQAEFTDSHLPPPNRDSSLVPSATTTSREMAQDQ